MRFWQILRTITARQWATVAVLLCVVACSAQNKIYLRRVGYNRFQVIERVNYGGARPLNPRWQVHEYAMDTLGAGVSDIGLGVWQYQESHLTEFVDYTDDASHRAAVWARAGWTPSGAAWSDDVNNNYPQSRTSGALVAAPVYDATLKMSFITAPAGIWDTGNDTGTATFSVSNNVYQVVACFSSTVMAVHGDASGEGTGKTVTYANADSVYTSAAPNVMKAKAAAGEYLSKQFTVASGKEGLLCVTIGATTSGSRWLPRTSGADHLGVGEFRLLRDFGDGLGYVDVACYGKIVRVATDPQTGAYRRTGIAGPCQNASTMKTAAYANQDGAGPVKSWFDVEVARHLPPGNYEVRVYSRDGTNQVNVSRGYCLYMSDPEPTDANVAFYDEEWSHQYVAPASPGNYSLSGVRTSDVLAFTTLTPAGPMFGPQHGWCRQTQTGSGFPDIQATLSDGTVTGPLLGSLANNTFYDPGGGKYITRLVVNQTTQVHENTTAAKSGTLTSNGANPTICTAMGDTATLVANDLIEIDMLRVTDGAATTTCVLTSVTGGFTAAMEGHTVRVSGGTAMLAGDYRLVKRIDANTIMLDRTVATGAGSGATVRVLNANPTSGWGGNYFRIGSVDSGTQVTLASGDICPSGTGLSWSAATWKHIATVTEQYTYDGLHHDESISIAWQASKTVDNLYVSMISPAMAFTGDPNRPKSTRIINEVTDVTQSYYPYDATGLHFQDRSGKSIASFAALDAVNAYGLDAYRVIVRFDKIENGNVRENGRLFIVETDTTKYTGTQNFGTGNRKFIVPSTNVLKVYAHAGYNVAVTAADTWTFTTRRYWAERDYFENLAKTSRRVIFFGD